MLINKRKTGVVVIAGIVIALCILIFSVRAHRRETLNDWLAITQDLYTAEQVVIEGYSDEPIIIQQPDKVEEFKNSTLGPERVHKFRRTIKRHISGEAFTISFLLPNESSITIETFKLSERIDDVLGFKVNDSYYIAMIEDQFCNIFLGADASEVLEQVSDN